MWSRLYATVTVDWEGVQIDDENLDILASFKSQFPKIPLTHFICPAYFTRGQEFSQQIGKIHAVTAGDEIGLHIHCWESLIAKSGVIPILHPTCHPHAPIVPYGDNKYDGGFAVPLGAYTISQIQQILRTSKQILVETGLTPAETCVSFRCGACLASDTVLSALRDEGFTNDASAIPSNVMTAVIARALPIFAAWVRALWGNREIQEPAYLANTIIHRAYPEGIQSCLLSHAHPISMPRVLEHGIVEVPGTGAMIDYISPMALYRYIQQAWTLSRRQDIYISFGFHLESATTITEFSDNMPLLSALIHILSMARQDGIAITYLTTQQVGEACR